MINIKRDNIETIIKSVQLDSIDFTDKSFRFRLDITPEAVNRLASSIEQIGLQNPVKVRKKGKKFQVISGWTRLHAMKKLGHKTVPVEIYPDISDNKAILIASSENIHRLNLSDLELSNQLHTLKEKYGIPTSTLVEWMGGKRQRTFDLIKLQSMDEDLKRAVHNGELSLYGAIELFKYPEKNKDYYVKKVIREKWSVRKIRNERRIANHPFAGVYSKECKEKTMGLFHALKYERYEEIEAGARAVWNNAYKHMGVPGPFKCRTTLTIRASENDPPYICQNDIDWVVVAKGRIDPRGRDVYKPSNDIQKWPGWAFLCDECTKLVFPSVTYHKDTPFIIPFLNPVQRHTRFKRA